MFCPLCRSKTTVTSSKSLKDAIEGRHTVLRYRRCRNLACNYHFKTQETFKAEGYLASAKRRRPDLEKSP